MRLPGPTDVVKLAGQGYDAAGKAMSAAERAMSLVPRLVALVGEVEQLMVVVRGVVGHIERTTERADQVVAQSETVVLRAQRVVATTEHLTAIVTPLLERIQPALTKLEPVVIRLADTTSAAEVDAMIALVNTLPEISDKMRADILPILDTLGTVAPDLRDLLDTSRELNEILGNVPGLGRIKKRIEDRQDAQDAHRTNGQPTDQHRGAAYRADETPPPAPARQGRAT